MSADIQGSEIHPGVLLRRTLNVIQPSLAIGAHDAIGATLGEDTGFDAIWASGLEVSTSRGVADANILTLAQSAEAASIMARATKLPVLADCDNGFGGADAAAETVRRFEQGGIAGICIEDKEFPKRNSFAEGPQDLESIASFTHKLDAACKARADKNFVIVARIEALIAGAGMDEAHRRADAYVRAGADAILIHSKSRTPDEVIEFAQGFGQQTPLLVVPTKYPHVTLDELGSAGVSMAIYANQGLRASISAMRHVFGEIRRLGNSSSVEGSMASVSCLLGMFGTDESAGAATDFSPALLGGELGNATG